MPRPTFHLHCPPQSPVWSFSESQPTGTRSTQSQGRESHLQQRPFSLGKLPSQSCPAPHPPLLLPDAIALRPQREGAPRPTGAGSRAQHWPTKNDEPSTLLIRLWPQLPEPHSTSSYAVCNACSPSPSRFCPPALLHLPRNQMLRVAWRWPTATATARLPIPPSSPAPVYHVLGPMLTVLPLCDRRWLR